MASVLRDFLRDGSRNTRGNVNNLGSEWPYVIVSTVRSRSLLEIRNELNHSKAWLGKNLGFITKPNLVNVTITRAQDGLCILGNRHLLECSELWRRLLSHYQSQDCVVDPAQNIRVKHRMVNQRRTTMK